MKHVTIINKSQFPLDEIMPILRAAYRSVKPEITRPPVRPLPVTLEHTRKRTWMCKWNRNAGQNTARLLFSKPGRTFHETAVGDLPLHSMTEVILAVSAWTFASILAKPALGRSCASAALQEYRNNPAALDGVVSAAAQLKKDREGDAFASMIFKQMEESTLDHKLAEIAKKEKVWLRKARLAETKLKSLRRRRSALLAADKRKRQTTEAQVATTALPLQLGQP